jgi:hypothetical protein
MSDPPEYMPDVTTEPSLALVLGEWSPNEWVTLEDLFRERYNTNWMAWQDENVTRLARRELAQAIERERQAARRAVVVEMVACADRVSQMFSGALPQLIVLHRRIRELGEEANT